MNITNIKTPKGTIDLYSEEYNKMEYYKSKLENIFKQYGGVGLETPVFEQRENLLGKYGDEAETKLVFNIENSGTDEAEKYTLRYDLTIPKVRFIKSKSIDKARIYSIGKVYRRDNPSLGRYREFYQADFDIIGENSCSLINEVILLKLASEFLESENIGSYKILINSTTNLFYMLEKITGTTNFNFKSICSSIDKLDKVSFDNIVEELNQKGLNDSQIELLKIELEKSEPSNPDTIEQITKLKLFASKYGFDSKIQFTPYMARGLDYYNGMIWEIVLDNFKSTIISGGRYDGLIENTSLVGISFGLSRMFGLLNTQNQINGKIYTCA